MQLLANRRRCGSSFLYVFRPVSLIGGILLLALAAYLAGHYAQVRPLVLAGALLSILADANGCFALSHNHRPLWPILAIDSLAFAILIPAAISVGPPKEGQPASNDNTGDAGDVGPPPWKDLQMVTGIITAMTM